MRMNFKLLKTVKNKPTGTRRNELGYHMEDYLDYTKDRDTFAGHKHSKRSKKKHTNWENYMAYHRQTVIILNIDRAF